MIADSYSLAPVRVRFLRQVVVNLFLMIKFSFSKLIQWETRLSISGDIDYFGGFRKSNSLGKFLLYRYFSSHDKFLYE